MLTTRVDAGVTVAAALSVPVIGMTLPPPAPTVTPTATDFDRPLVEERGVPLVEELALASISKPPAG